MAAGHKKSQLNPTFMRSKCQWLGGLMPMQDAKMLEQISASRQGERNDAYVNLSEDAQMVPGPSLTRYGM